METMEQYTIFCTPDQTRKAFELGAPIEELGYTCIEGWIYEKVTAEQMISWLEEQDIFINVNHISAGYGSWLKTISKNEYISENLGYTKSRKEATLAAIDAALDYLRKTSNMTQKEKIIETIKDACFLSSSPEELLKFFEQKLCVDYDYLQNWFIDSNENRNPHWTDKHITELCEDFYLIPKR